MKLSSHDYALSDGNIQQYTHGMYLSPCAATTNLVIRVSSLVDEELGDLEVAVLDCYHEKSVAVVIHLVQVKRFLRFATALQG